MAGQSQILRQLIQSVRRVVVLHGPAAAGKTMAGLEFYRYYQKLGEGSACLLIAPNIQAIDYLKRSILNSSPCGAVMSPAVTTFSAVAAKILGACDVKSQPMPTYRRRMLLRQIIDDIKCQAGLPALWAVADSPGLIVAIDRTISELKRAAVDPESLAAAIGPARSAEPDKARDLLEIYRRYQARMQAADRHDVEGRLWLARDCLRDGAARSNERIGLGGVSAVVVDGFLDFTPTQLEILVLIAGRVDKLVITLPYANDGRSRLWQWTNRTLDRIRHAFAAELDEIACPPPEGQPLQPLWENVFNVNMEAKGQSLPPELHLTAASGIDAEIASAAQRIKRLLADGCRAGQIAVLARSLEVYEPIIQQIFAEHGIPISPQIESLTDVPIIRFVLDVAGLWPEFEFQNVLRIIKSSYFLPSALGAFDASTVTAAEAVIRRGNVLLGRQSYEDAVGRMAWAAKMAAQRDAESDPTDAAGPLDSAENIEAAGRMLKALFDICERDNRESRIANCELSTETEEETTRRRDASDTRGQDVRDTNSNNSTGKMPVPRTTGGGILAEIVAALNLQSAAIVCGEPAFIARDLRALAAMNDAMASINDVRIAGALPGVEILREILQAVACPAARGESMVDVLDALDARAVRYEHVFLLGVSEGRFPQHLFDSPMLGEHNRTAWAAKGLQLDSPGDLLAREMLLFYLAISRSRHLHISYLQADAAGKAQSPSNFLLSLLEPFGGLKAADKAGLIDSIPPGRFAPPADRIASQRDAFNAGVTWFFGAADGDEPAGRDMFAWAALHDREKLNRAVMGIWASHRRWTRGPCNEFDGRLSDQDLLKHLHHHYTAAPADGGTVFSASGLNSYGSCPWQYFAAYILKLSELIMPQRQLEAVGRGIFCHNVLYRMMSMLRKEHGTPVFLGKLDKTQVLATLDLALQAEAVNIEAGTVAYPMLWQLQKAQMTRQLRTYIKDLAGRGPAAGGSLYFELTFGMPQYRDELGDATDTARPVVMQTPAGPIHVKGKIDRVDKIAFGDEEALMAIDYKTGGLPTLKEILAGRNVQLPVYQAAATALLHQPCIGGVFHRIGDGDKKSEQYFSAAEFDGGEFIAAKNFDKNRQIVMDKIGGFIEGMRAGRFDHADVVKCSSDCSYRTICNFSPARQELKQKSSSNVTVVTPVAEGRP